MSLNAYSPPSERRDREYGAAVELATLYIYNLVVMLFSYMTPAGTETFYLFNNFFFRNYLLKYFWKLITRSNEISKSKQNAFIPRMQYLSPNEKFLITSRESLIIRC